MDRAEFYLKDLESKFAKINPSEYYLSYSGGKDSHLLYWFIKEWLKDDKIKIVGINTYMEHEEIRKRIYDNCDIVLFPTMKPFEIKEKYGIPCFSKEQDFYIYYYQKALREKRDIPKSILPKIERTTKYAISKKASDYVLSGNAHKITHLCCHYLKKEPARKFEKQTGLKAILGIRGGESNLRKNQYKSCFTKDLKFTPLWDLEDELLDEIYRKYNIEIPNVYEFVKRTGCMGCPYGSYKHDTEKELKLISKKQRRFVCEYFKESYKVLGISDLLGEHNEE